MYLLYLCMLQERIQLRRDDDGGKVHDDTRREIERGATIIHRQEDFNFLERSCGLTADEQMHYLFIPFPVVALASVAPSLAFDLVFPSPYLRRTSRSNSRLIPPRRR